MMGTFEATVERREQESRRLLPRSSCVARRVLLVVMAGAAACGAPPPRTASPARPLEELRAAQVIAGVFRSEGWEPLGGTAIQLLPGAALQVAVRARGRGFGVAYLSALERQRLGEALPRRDEARTDALQLVAGYGDDRDARILVLYDSDYLYDDHFGGSGRASTITAERKLERDVRDFLVRARAENWP